MKIDAEIVNGLLVLKDPRRSDPTDQGTQWLVLPVNDGNPMKRASARDIAVAAAEVDTLGVWPLPQVGATLTGWTEDAPLRERRAAAMKNLALLAALRAEVEQAIRDNVTVARTAASQWHDYGQPTWEQIGRALGVTKQAAASRYTV